MPEYKWKLEDSKSCEGCWMLTDSFGCKLFYAQQGDDLTRPQKCIDELGE